jgi:CRISPR/Cas system-associated exonuclease Cas4 (RecB family)
MLDLITPIMESAASRIKRMPCKSNRASMIGYFIPELGGCLRRGVYERTRWQEKELHSPETQLIFDEGNEQERWVLKSLAEAGITVIEQQTMFEWTTYNITGHVDGKLIIPGFDYAIPLEIKSMHPAIFDSVNCFEDFKKKSWTRAYMAQGTVYMLCQSIDTCVFLLKNKSNGQYKQININLDYELGEWCVSAAEKINTFVANDAVPDRIEDRKTCMDCPFKLICLPDIQFGTELKITEDPIFEQRIDRYLLLKPDSMECIKIYDQIKSQSKATAGESGEMNLIVGKYHLTSKFDAAKRFQLDIKIID